MLAAESSYFHCEPNRSGRPIGEVEASLDIVAVIYECRSRSHGSKFEKLNDQAVAISRDLFCDSSRRSEQCLSSFHDLFISNYLLGSTRIKIRLRTAVFCKHRSEEPYTRYAYRALETRDAILFLVPGKNESLTEVHPRVYQRQLVTIGRSTPLPFFSAVLRRSHTSGSR